MIIFFLFFIYPFLRTLTTTSATEHCTTGTLFTPYKKCLTLPTQESTLAWTYHPQNSTLHIAFFGAFISPSGWVGVGINPTSPQMTGTRSLIAFSDPDSGSLLLLPFILAPSVKLQSSPLVSHPLDHVHLLSSSATLLNHDPQTMVHEGQRVRIHAALKLNPNHTTINLVWNRGLYVQGYSPTMHPTSSSDLSSRATIDLLSPSATVKQSISLRPVHAILNAVSWGFFLPVGVVAARYIRHCPNAGPTWFYVHAAVQIPGFLMGAAGFGTGMVMGRESVGVTYTLHRGMGIAAFCMGGMQALALVFRPGTTNRWRKYWKSYHHLVGYGCVVVGVVNVFQGFEVMGLGNSYFKMVYCLALATVVGVCAVLEVNSWVVFCREMEVERVGKEGDGDGEMKVIAGDVYR